MGWITFAAHPARASRGRRGSMHPADVLASRMAEARGWDGAVLNAMVLGWSNLSVVGLALRRWGPRRWRDVLLCMREGLVPRDLDEARENIGPGADRSWVSPRAKRAICALLDPQGAGDDRALSDKYHFDRLARAAGLPLPETIGRGKLDAPLPAWIGSGSGLILKRGYSLQGKGIVALAREGAEWRADGRPVGDLIGWLRANLDPAGIVQHRLRTHAALADLSPTALPTLRVIVCLNEQGEPEPTHAFLRLGPIGSALDNFSAGGISAAADLETGILAEARIWHGRGGRVDRIGRHPVTDAASRGGRCRCSRRRWRSRRRRIGACSTGAGC